MKSLFVFLLIFLVATTATAQPSFVDYQKSYPRFAAAVKLKEDTLKKQVEAAGFTWPLKQMYVRSFKFDSQLEVWARNSDKEQFKLFKTYKVCALAGSLGPKRMEGDYQVPEGFYYINQFNPKSSFHLSLGLNYPNASDKILSDSISPGSDIFIHGKCVTTGCIPILDNQIEELYIMAAHAKSQGQDFIPVHIFPVRYNNPRSVEALNKTLKENTELTQFANRLKEVYEYFEEKKKLPIISVNKKGEYLVLN
jgi:murein L,D-transpeptidase YafK